MMGLHFHKLHSWLVGLAVAVLFYVLAMMTVFSAPLPI